MRGTLFRDVHLAGEHNPAVASDRRSRAAGKASMFTEGTGTLLMIMEFSASGEQQRCPSIIKTNILVCKSKYRIRGFDQDDFVKKITIRVDIKLRNLFSDLYFKRDFVDVVPSQTQAGGTIDMHNRQAAIAGHDR